MNNFNVKIESGNVINVQVVDKNSITVKVDETVIKEKIIEKPKEDNNRE